MLDFSNKTILVTGATGLIGSNIVDQLMKYNHVKVIASVRNEAKAMKIFSDYLQKDNFCYIVHDICEKLDGLNETVDYIFHTAGPIAGSIIKTTPVDVIIPNLDGLRNCLDFLKLQMEEKHHKGRLVLFSSATIYNRPFDQLTQDLRVSETDTNITEYLEQDSAVYSETKRMCEVMGRSYATQYGVDVVIARLSYVYGYTPIFPDTAFYQFITTALNGKDIHLNNTAFTKRDNIYIRDAVDGLLYICLYGKNGEAYNVSSNGDLGNYTSVDCIASYVVSSVNKNSSEKKISVYGPVDATISHLPGIVLDNSKLRALGWSVQTGLECGIDEIISLCHKKERG